MCFGCLFSGSFLGRDGFHDLKSGMLSVSILVSLPRTQVVSVLLRTTAEASHSGDTPPWAPHSQTPG
jgi:hypothetical protein